MRMLTGGAEHRFQKVSKWLAAAALVAACTLLAPSRASADQLTVFDLTGTFTNGDTFNAGSSVTIDVTTGYVTTASIVISGTGYNESFSGSPLAPLSQYTATWDGSSNDVLALFALPPDYWTNFTGGTNIVIDGGLNVNGFLAGVVATLTDPPGQGYVTAPEPSSLVLLSIGALALLGMTLMRKRTAQSAQVHA